MEKCVGKGKDFGTLLTDFSKAFDYLDRKLLTYKLNIYTLNIPALRLIHDYLSNRKQRIKIESIWIVFEVTQVSILRPLFFNIFLADLFFIINNIDIASYAKIIADIVADNVEEASIALFQWFYNNLLKKQPWQVSFPN